MQCLLTFLEPAFFFLKELNAAPLERASHPHTHTRGVFPQEINGSEGTQIQLASAIRVRPRLDSDFERGLMFNGAGHVSGILALVRWMNR